MKAADIDTDEFLDTVERLGDEWAAENSGSIRWTSIWALCRAFPIYPEKVILAKARGLLKRGYLDGCGCGCRGDFSVYENYGMGPNKLPRPTPTNRRGEQ